MTNILVNKLPTKVRLNGEDISVNYGFKAFILIELCFFDKERTEAQRAMDALNIFYADEIPADIDAAFKKLIWFYRCGEDEPTQQQAARQQMKKQPRAYDFKVDQKLIYAAFRQQYNIDLNAIRSDDLHWWAFRALFEGLGEDCTFCRIMNFRTMDLSGLKGKQLKYYQKMKETYSLADKTTVTDNMALARRNARMRQYIKERYKELNNE